MFQRYKSVNPDNQYYSSLGYLFFFFMQRYVWHEQYILTKIQIICTLRINFEFFHNANKLITGWNVTCKSLITYCDKKNNKNFTSILMRGWISSNFRYLE